MWKPEHRLAAERRGLRYPSDMTDCEWTLIAPLIPAANAYLSGRGYFELAAARNLPFHEVRRLRKINKVRLFGAGLFMAALLAVPIANLLMPLFGTAFMVRITRDILRSARKTPDAALGSK